MKKLIAASALAIVLVVGASTPANAYWYNTTTVQGSQSIQVRNTDGKVFRVAPRNSASDVNLAWAGIRQCLRIKNMQTFQTWTKCFPKGGTWAVPAAPFGGIELVKYNY